MPLSAAVGLATIRKAKVLSLYITFHLCPPPSLKNQNNSTFKSPENELVTTNWGQKYSCVCMCVYVHACGGGQNQKTDSCKKNLHNCNFELDSNALLLFTFQQVVHMAAHQNGLTLAGIESACAPYRMFHGTSRLIQVNINTASTEDFHITTSQFLWDDTFSLSIVFFFVEVGLIHLNSL